jgi:hypothetical protein
MSAVSKMSLEKLCAEIKSGFAADARLVLIGMLSHELRSDLPESAPVKAPAATKRKAKEVKASDGEEEKPKKGPTPWVTFIGRIRPLLKEAGGDAHKPTHPMKFGSDLKKAATDYLSLEDSEIVASYEAWLEEHKDDESTASKGSAKSKSSGRRSLTDEEKAERVKTMAAKRVEKAGGDPLAALTVSQLTALYYQLTNAEKPKKSPPKEFSKKELLMAEVRRLQNEKGDSSEDDLLAEMDEILA